MHEACVQIMQRVICIDASYIVRYPHEDVDIIMKDRVELILMRWSGWMMMKVGYFSKHTHVFGNNPMFSPQMMVSALDINRSKLETCISIFQGGLPNFSSKKHLSTSPLIPHRNVIILALVQSSKFISTTGAVIVNSLGAFSKGAMHLKYGLQGPQSELKLLKSGYRL